MCYDCPYKIVWKGLFEKTKFKMNFLRNVVKGQKDSGGLIGKVFNIQEYGIKVESQIGEGGFATIYRVSDINSRDRIYALKHFRLMGDSSSIADVQTEIDTLKKLRGSANILTLRAACFAGNGQHLTEAFVLLDLCSQSLVDYMKQQNYKISDTDVLSIFQSVCLAVQAMHHLDPPLSHR